jgi:hypothetical protein
MASRARRLAAVPEPEKAPRERAPDLRDALKTAVDAMDWLTPTDDALKALALRQAEEIEKSTDRVAELQQLLDDVNGDVDAYRRAQKLAASCDVVKTLATLGPQLQATLRDLGGTPAARALLKKDKPVGSRLAQLRDAAGQHDSG